MLQYARLIELFDLYEDGRFVNRISRGRAKEGERAGTEDVHGYRRILIDGKKYYEHHLVWFWLHEEWPDEIDHIDGDRSNNAPTNLRECNRSLNNCNRSYTAIGEAGLRGAYLNKRTMKWYSQIQFGGQVRYLGGGFDNPEEAHLLFERTAEQIHGVFYAPPTYTPNQLKGL
jgi:hypothetical protein